jgi:hypothetical protein
VRRASFPGAPAFFPRPPPRLFFPQSAFPEDFAVPALAGAQIRHGLVKGNDAFCPHLQAPRHAGQFRVRIFPKPHEFGHFLHVPEFFAKFSRASREFENRNSFAFKSKPDLRLKIFVYKIYFIYKVNFILFWYKSFLPFAAGVCGGLFSGFSRGGKGIYGRKFTILVREDFCDAGDSVRVEAQAWR